MTTCDCDWSQPRGWWGLSSGGRDENKWALMGLLFLLDFKEGTDAVRMSEMPAADTPGAPELLS